MTNGDKEAFDRAVKLKDAGNLEDARQMLTDLSHTNPKSVAVLCVLGHIYWEQRLLDEAATWFTRAVRLAPTLEAASLGLFHTLWAKGRYDEALEEIKRFQSHSDSEDYRQIIKEINEKL